jgi:hypothetical protein
VSGENINLYTGGASSSQGSILVAFIKRSEHDKVYSDRYLVTFSPTWLMSTKVDLNSSKLRRADSPLTFCTANIDS